MMITENLDTKTQIFNVALRLFASNGYENVSVRMIADRVGIKTASIYYHYKNKEEILNSCYDYFLRHRHITRLTPEQYGPIITQGSKEEILSVINYNFPNDIVENMIMTLVIIYARMYCDNRAKEVYIDEVENSMRYLIGFFEYGVEIGRFHAFNAEAVALIILSARLFCAQSVSIVTELQNYWFQAADDVFNDLLNLIPFEY